MEKRRVRFAVSGCGRISTAHLDAVKNAPDAELAAVCDVVEEKAKQTALDNGLDRYRQPMITGEEGRKPVDLVLAIYESSRKGCEVKV